MSTYRAPLCTFTGCRQLREHENHKYAPCERAHQLLECHPFEPEENPYRSPAPRLFCGCPLDSGCDGYHSIEASR